jgi:uncharacterized protein YkwD
MSRIRTLGVVAVVGCLLAMLPSQALAGRAESSLVSKVNQVRASHGLAPLRAVRTLNGSSRRYVRTMLRMRYFGHLNSIRMSGRFRRRGEVLAQHPGRRARPGVAVSQWMASPMHRTLLLDGGFRYIGVGRGYGSFGARAVTGWVAQLGS